MQIKSMNTKHYPFIPGVAAHGRPGGGGDGAETSVS